MTPWRAYGLFAAGEPALRDAGEARARDFAEALEAAGLAGEALVESEGAGARVVVEPGAPAAWSPAGKVDAGAPQTFAGMLRRAPPGTPVYAVLWGHGTGWPGASSVGPASLPTRPWEAIAKLAPENLPGKGEDLDQQAMILLHPGKEGLDVAHLPAAFVRKGGERVDVAVLAACHMGALEVLAAIAPVVSVAVASPDRLPTASAALVRVAAGPPPADAQDAAARIVAAYGEEVRAIAAAPPVAAPPVAAPSGAADATPDGPWPEALHGWDLRWLATAAARLDALGAALAPRVDDPAVRTAVEQARNALPPWQARAYEAFDVGTVLAVFATQPGVLSDGERKLAGAVRSALVRSRLGSSPPAEPSPGDLRSAELGLSVFLPAPGAGRHPADYPGRGGWAEFAAAVATSKASGDGAPA